MFIIKIYKTAKNGVFLMKSVQKMIKMEKIFKKGIEIMQKRVYNLIKFIHYYKRIYIRW